MLAVRSAVAGHRTVADVAVPAVDAAAVVKARMTGAGRRVGRRHAAVRHADHLLDTDGARSHFTPHLHCVQKTPLPPKQRIY